MHEELYGGSRPDFVRKMGNEVSFPETLNSEQEMAGVISKVLEALDTSDIQPTTEAEMKRLAAVCQSWGYGAVCQGTSEQVAAILGKKIWARGARRIKPPPFGPFGPESVQKARSCQMERKSQFLTADSRGDSMVISHVVGKAADGGWWFAGVAITQADAPAAASPQAPADTGRKSTSSEVRSRTLAAEKAASGMTSAQVTDKGEALPSARKMREPAFDGNALLMAEKKGKAL
ncbi:MAG: hypothetical protein GXY83_17405, partial [Rhodopirellula sp.]|nr:hypothetical protein [Rhodopirellula sp.]